MGTKNILDECILNKIPRIIYSASSSCYGIPKKYPTLENEKIDPRYPYALTKRIGEELILHYSKIYNLKGISLRLFNVMVQNLGHQAHMGYVRCIFKTKN